MTESLNIPLSEEIEIFNKTYAADKLHLLINFPWYALMLMTLPVTPTGMSTPIAAVSFTEILLNAISSKRAGGKHKAYYEYSQKTRIYLLSHEILHPSLGHMPSITNTLLNHYLANVAQDAIINRILLSSNIVQFDSVIDEIPGLVTCDLTKNEVVVLTGTALEERVSVPNLANVDWYPIYEKLVEHFNNKPDFDKYLKALQKFIDIRTENSDKATKHKTHFFSKMISITQTLKRGDQPSEILRMMGRFKQPKVDWKDILNNLIATVFSKVDFSYAHNPRKAHIGFLPGLDQNAEFNIVAAVDTSGSMTQDLIDKGLSEFKGLRDTRPFTFTIISCDAAIHSVDIFDGLTEISWDTLQIKGGGGTNFIPVFEYIENQIKETQVTPNLLVFFTDSYGIFPNKAPDYPVLWLVPNENIVKIPFGDVIVVE